MTVMITIALPNPASQNYERNAATIAHSLDLSTFRARRPHRPSPHHPVALQAPHYSSTAPMEEGVDPPTNTEGRRMIQQLAAQVILSVMADIS